MRPKVNTFSLAFGLIVLCWTLVVMGKPKSRTKPSKFKPSELSMWNKLLPGGDFGKELALDTGFLGISFNDFLVRKITIRYKTFSEIIADIGGLWAAAFLLLGILWKKSGYLSSPAGEEMWIFKYLPRKMKAKMLLGKDEAPAESVEVAPA